MQLPIFKEKFELLLTRKRLLFILIVVFLITFFICSSLVASYFCIKSNYCSLILSQRIPFLKNITGVQETDYILIKNNLTFDKQLNVITVTGKIDEVQSDRVVIDFGNGNKNTFLVKTGTEFVIIDYFSEASLSEGNKQVYDGENLAKILPLDYYLIAAKFVNNQITSETKDKDMVYYNPIMVVRNLK